MAEWAGADTCSALSRDASDAGVGRLRFEVRHASITCPWRFEWPRLLKSPRLARTPIHSIFLSAVVGNRPATAWVAKDRAVSVQGSQTFSSTQGDLLRRNFYRRTLGRGGRAGLVPLLSFRFLCHSAAVMLADLGAPPSRYSSASAISASLSR